MKGKFIVIEGGDGSGKDTQLDLLKKDFTGPSFVFTREPGGTPIGQEIRKILLHSTEKLTIEAEAFLFLADRAQHMAQLIEPSLAAGINVISSRSWPSVIAYQIYGRDRHDMRALIDMAHEKIYKSVEPDLIVYLDLAPEIGLARSRARGNLDAIERAPIEVHERIRTGFHAILDGKPNVLIIDATRSIEDIHTEILSKINSLLA